MRGILRRASLVPTLLALVSGATFLSVPAASASSGGGCDPGTVGYGGFSVKACISASNDNLIADAYGYGSTSGSCSMYIEIVDASYNVIARSGDQSCTSGHHNGTSIWELSGTYKAAACLYWGGAARGCSFSKPITN